MDDIPYFVGKHDYPLRPCLDSHFSTDVLVVGGGMAGVSAAYHLARKGAKVALIEAERIAHGTTGLSAGMLVDSIEDDFCEQDLAVHKEICTGIEGILRAIRKHEIACDLMSTGSIYLGKKRHEQQIHREYRARLDGGFPVVLFSREEIQEEIRVSQNYITGMFYREGHCIDAVAFTQGLADVTQATIFEHTSLRSFDARKRYAETSTGARIDYGDLVLTCGKIDALRGKVFFARSYVGVSEPLDDKIWTHERMLWDADAAYTYVRPVGGRRILVGGGERLVTSDGGSDSTKPIVQRLFTSFFQGVDAAFSSCWSGVMSLPVDLLPFVDEIRPRHYVGVYNVGLPLSFQSGQLLAEKIAGKKTHDLFAIGRKMPLVKRLRALTKFQPFTAIGNMFMRRIHKDL